MTDAVIIAIIGAGATVATSTLSLLASLRNHNTLTRVERQTNGLLKDRDKATSAIAHAEGMAAQKAKETL